MASCAWRHGTAGGHREATSVVDLAAVLAAVRALEADLPAVQPADRELARSDRADQPRAIAETLGAGWVWSSGSALSVTTSGHSRARSGRPAYGTLLLSRLPLAEVEQLRLPPAGGEQRTALVATIRVGSYSVTVAAAHLSNKQGHSVRQLQQLQGVLADRPAPRLLLGDLNNLPSTVLPLASRRGWPETGRGDTLRTSAPTGSWIMCCATTRPGCCDSVALGGRRAGERSPCPGGRPRGGGALTGETRTSPVVCRSAPPQNPGTCQIAGERGSP